MTNIVNFMSKYLVKLLTVCIFMIATIAAPVAQSTTSYSLKTTNDKSGEYAFVLPKDWRNRDLPKFNHDVIFLPKIDDKNRTVIISDQKGPGPVKDILAKYERALPKAFKDFKLESSGMVKLPNGKTVAKLAHTNTTPGVAVRQLNYIIELADKYYYIAFTCMESDGVVFDETVDSFVASIVPVGRLVQVTQQ